MDTVAAQSTPWLGIFAIGAVEFLNRTEFLRWYPLFEAFEAGAVSFFFTDRGIEVCTLPTIVKWDENHRLHSTSGPAFVWLNDIRDYYWHGVRVDSYVVDNPERITVADIEAESIDAVRKAKIERFSQAHPNVTAPRFPPVTADELKERYLHACNLKQKVDWEKIVDCFRRWAAAFKIEVPAVVRLEEAEQVKKSAMAAFHTKCAGSSGDAIRKARGQSSSPDKWGSWARMFEMKAMAARDMSTWETANFTNDRRAEFINQAERNEKQAIFFREKSATSAASAANVARSARIEPAFLATRNTWVSNFQVNGRTIPNWGVLWDVTNNAITVIDTLEQTYDGTNFSSWYPLFEAFEAGAFCYFLTDRGIEVCTLPSVVKVDDRRRLHSPSGPAFVWLNDVQDYYWHGVRVESYVVDNPERITVADIEAEPNVEVRRVKIERFGQTRYLVESGAQEIHRDDYGTLYRKEIPGDEPLVMVKVVNATPEPDGSFKDYFLRVPPTIHAAREAVAWTFGKTLEDYQPVKET